MDQQSSSSSTPETFADALVQLKRERLLHVEELHKKDVELQDRTRRWKETARELSKVLAQSRGSHQFTDRDLLDMVRPLRSDIQSFAIKYFSDDLPRGFSMRQLQGGYARYMKYCTPNARIFSGYVRSSKKCPSLVQAFIWKVLAHEVLGRFRWAGSVRDHVDGLNHFLKLPTQGARDTHPAMDEITIESSRMKRKYQLWKATTTELVLDSLTTTKESRVDKDETGVKEEIVTTISETIEPYLRSFADGYVERLDEIVEAAFKLDKELSRQMAEISCGFESTKRPPPFDANAMELQHGEYQGSGRPAEVLLTVAPAIFKRGNSDGEDFETERTVLAPVVSCSYQDD